jgi:hypothetical protein
MRAAMNAAGPKTVTPEHRRAVDPALQRLARPFRYLELNRSLRLAPHDGNPLFHVTRKKM